MIVIQDLTKAYTKGAKPAVQGLDLHVKPGEIFGFIGPNGAGKTTTIKLMTGILAPDSGSIRINGVSMSDEPVAAKRMIGYVPDNHDIYDRLKGIEYLHFIADIYGTDAALSRERIEKYLEMFDIADAAGDLIRTYSHGMKQKLLLSAALLPAPPLWLLDEPMVGLDPKAALRLKQEMRAHCDQGNTVFFSTHVLDVAERLCDRIGIIQHGKLIAVGTLEELRKGETGRTLEAIFFEHTQPDGAGE